MAVNPRPSWLDTEPRSRAEVPARRSPSRRGRDRLSRGSTAEGRKPLQSRRAWSRPGSQRQRSGRLRPKTRIQRRTHYLPRPTGRAALWNTARRTPASHACLTQCAWSLGRVRRFLWETSQGEWRNGRRAGLRSRCRASGVSVRPRPRPPEPPLTRGALGLASVERRIERLAGNGRVQVRGRPFGLQLAGGGE